MTCLFCNFAEGKQKTHQNGYPFIKLNETKHTFSFLAIDFVAHEDGHMLVVPKRHFKNFKELPRSVLHDLSEHLSLAARITRKRHEACNVLLNDGKFAEQRVMHVHFHVIPRDRGDDIHIESWKRKQLDLDKFTQLSKRIRKSFFKVA